MPDPLPSFSAGLRARAPGLPAAPDGVVACNSFPHNYFYFLKKESDFKLQTHSFPDTARCPDRSQCTDSCKFWKTNTVFFNFLKNIPCCLCTCLLYRTRAPSKCFRRDRSCRPRNSQSSLRNHGTGTESSRTCEINSNIIVKKACVAQYPTSVVSCHTIWV